MAEAFRYAAFISYSSADAAFAQRLHRALEGYGIPTSLGKFDLLGAGGKRNRIYPVFRDREELSAGDLGERIETSLKASGALIVVCSPNAANSPWVQKEIEFFIGLGRRDRVFAIIPDNVKSVDASGADCTPSCFPPAFRGDALKDANALEPLAADARPGKDGFRNAWLKLVAGLVGVSPGQIVDRDRRRRRQRAMQMAATLVVAALGLGSAYANRSTLETLADSWLNYRPHVEATQTLMSGVVGPGSAFQDCAEGSANCPVMVVLPAGEFIVGAAEGDSELQEGASPLRRISIERLAVSQHEITFGNWRACFNAHACGDVMPQRFADPGADRNCASSATACEDVSMPGWEGDDRPVINISWDDAQRYVAWLSGMTGQRYRLLTEAEWEYAARGAVGANAERMRFFWGDSDPICETGAANGAAFAACSPQHTFPVGSFRPNAFGLYDMHGNAPEWVQDCFQEPYDPSSNDGAAVEAEACEFRVVRGGSWASIPQFLRSASRDMSDPAQGWNDIGNGFRVARTLVEPAAPPTNAPRSAAEPAPANVATEAVRDCADCPEIVLIPSGSFAFGSLEGGDGATGIDAFWAGRFEVTFDQWEMCVSRGGCAGNRNPSDEGWGRGDHPVINVSWNDAQDYVRWLSNETGRRYRLLSEAEWEFAARNGEVLRAHVNKDSTTNVGAYPANSFGLHDVVGNAEEWVQDCMDDRPLIRTNGDVWERPDCSERVLRGGAWASPSRGGSPSVYISHGDAAERYPSTGFRVARDR
jgi:formylglycine-generating enzyme required for sulfatase activity